MCRPLETNGWSRKAVHSQCLMVYCPIRLPILIPHIFSCARDSESREGPRFNLLVFLALAPSSGQGRVSTDTLNHPSWALQLLRKVILCSVSHHRPASYSTFETQPRINRFEEWIIGCSHGPPESSSIDNSQRPIVSSAHRACMSNSFLGSERFVNSRREELEESGLHRCKLDGRDALWASHSFNLIPLVHY